jgi:hypothetical protein
MPLHRLLENEGFSPDQIQVMASAFEAACVELDHADANDPIREKIARKVIEYTQRGETDPFKLKTMVVADF